MENDEIGVIPGITVVLKKTEADFIKFLLEKRMCYLKDLLIKLKEDQYDHPKEIEEATNELKNPSLIEKRIKDMMRYNVWTVKMYSDLVCLDISTITSYTRPAIVAPNTIGYKLDVCYPFADVNGTGPKFILRNEKSEKLLRPISKPSSESNPQA
jgi:hypothetical protein